MINIEIYITINITVRMMKRNVTLTLIASEEIKGSFMAGISATKID
jgi:hypothetical protein